MTKVLETFNGTKTLAIGVRGLSSLNDGTDRYLAGAMDSVKAKPKPTFMLSHERSIVIKKSRVRMPALDTFQIDIFSRLFVAKLES